MARFGALPSFLTRLLGTCVGPVYTAVSATYRFMSTLASRSYCSLSAGHSVRHSAAKSLMTVPAVDLLLEATTIASLILAWMNRMYADLNRFGASGAFGWREGG